MATSWISRKGEILEKGGLTLPTMVCVCVCVFVCVCLGEIYIRKGLKHPANNLEIFEAIISNLLVFAQNGG